MTSGREEALLRLARAVADGRPIDWDGESSARPDDEAVLSNLRAVETVASFRYPVPAEIETITQWGPLRVLEYVRRGGFGELFRAYDPVLQREVALKLWRTDHASSAATRARLLAEARHLARIRHPHVVTVYGADEHEGRGGLWMELVRGETLEERLGRGTFSVRDAAAIGVTLCRALSALHAAGLVHRDVKSSNVILEDGGRVVLLDLGAAGEIIDSHAADGSSLGTLRSMAPEQLRGDPVGATGDVYSLGVLMYRLVSGRYPVEGDDVAGLLAKHARGDHMPLRDVRSDLPEDFVAVVERALAPEAQHRFVTAREMEQALESVLKNSGDSLTSPRSSRAVTVRRLVAGGLVVIALAAGVSLGVDLGKHKRSSSPTTPIESDTSPAIALDSTIDASGGKLAVPGEASALAASDASTKPPLVATASLYRHTIETEERLVPGSSISPGDSLCLNIMGSDSMYVYILDEDERGEMFVLFPVANLDLQNPLPGDETHRLPGTWRGRRVDWQVTSAGGKEDIVVIASRAPLETLREEIARLPETGFGPAPRPAENGPGGRERLRGVGRLVLEPGRDGAPSRQRIAEIVRGLAKNAQGSNDAWLWEIVLKNPGS